MRCFCLPFIMVHVSVSICFRPGGFFLFEAKLMMTILNIIFITVQSTLDVPIPFFRDIIINYFYAGLVL